MNVLVGSRALGYWQHDLKIRPETDWDIISDKSISGSEWHEPSLLNNDDMRKYADLSATVEFGGERLYVMNVVGLSIMKRSHLWRDLSFQKHITHYHKFMLHHARKYYTKEQESDLAKRTELTHRQFPQGYPKLNKSVKDFFDDAVTKVFDHDYLHQVVAYYDQPLYIRLQKDVKLAWCNKDLWYNLKYKDKVRCVAEEAKVIAIERFLVPNNWCFSSKHAYIKSLDKVCTTLCSGWFRDFAIDNYTEVLAEYDKEQFVHFMKVLN